MSSHSHELPLQAKLQLRAHLLNKIRAFMAQRQILEVETPLVIADHSSGLRRGLDPAMQALVTKGSGDIYQIGQVFRDDAKGRKHWPVFSLLCWWRQTPLQIQMQELAELTAAVCGSEVFDINTRSYRQAFIQRLELDPYQAEIKTLQQAAQRLGLRQRCGDDKQAWLDLLFSQFIEPTLGYDEPLFLIGLPPAKMPDASLDEQEAGQATLSFAFYIDGLKLASGRQCLLQPVDVARSYTGVNLGLDRLAMLLADVRRIEQVLVLPV